MTYGAEIDTTPPFRSIPRLVELVGFVLATSPSNEVDWLEWKCGLDLSKASGRFVFAKQILGFSNRDPGRSANHAGGCAFLVLGAEPGNRPASLRWIPRLWRQRSDRMSVPTARPGCPSPSRSTGRTSLSSRSSPPAWGDRIHTLRKEYRDEKGNGAEDGAVFVRRAGGTHRASSGEMEMLQRRLQSQPADGLEVVVHSMGRPIPRVDLTDDAIRAWLSSERRRLLAPMEAAEALRRAREDARTRPLTPDERQALAPELTAIQQVFHSRGMDFDRIQALTGGGSALDENRTPEAFRSEVEKYLAAAEKQVVACAIKGFPEAVDAPLFLRVVNTGDRNLESVEIVVSFSDAVFSPEDYDCQGRRARGDRGRYLVSILGSISNPSRTSFRRYPDHCGPATQRRTRAPRPSSSTHSISGPVRSTT